jgi:serine/threonine protein kinase
MSHQKCTNKSDFLLQPENLLLSGNGDDSDIKLADFGFATFATSNESLTTKCGTLTYVAPEIILSKRYGAYDNFESNRAFSNTSTTFSNIIHLIFTTIHIKAVR